MDNAVFIAVVVIIFLVLFVVLVVIIFLVLFLVVIDEYKIVLIVFK